MMKRWDKAVLFAFTVAMIIFALAACGLETKPELETEPSCKHEWLAATCTEPKTCSKCGKTEGVASGHLGIKYEVIQEPTCSTDGVRKGVCVSCGKELTDRLSATGDHVINDWLITTEPTCAAKGEREGTCTICGNTITEAIEKLAHTDDNTWVVIKSASALSNGKKATHCKVCGEVLQEESFELSLEEKNAVKKAESYLNYMAFSRKGLIEQLEFEGFSNEAATIAVDSVVVDWNEQAAKKAESYLSMMSFSRSGLIEQLKFEGFTSEQAEYGATQVGY